MRQVFPLRWVPTRPLAFTCKNCSTPAVGNLLSLPMVPLFAICGHRQPLATDRAARIRLWYNQVVIVGMLSRRERSSRKGFPNRSRLLGFPARDHLRGLEGNAFARTGQRPAL